MLQKIKQLSFVLFTAMALIGTVHMTVVIEPALAQANPPALVAPTGTAFATPTPATQGATATGATAFPSTATGAAGATRAETGKTSDGISLQGLPPSDTVAIEAELMRQKAEEEAARAAAEEAKREQEHNAKSYKKASMGLLPLSPDQVRSFMHRLESTQDAAQPPFTGQPKGEVKVASLSLDPGGEPPVINLAAGFVTTIDIVDATGAPWPILDVGIGGNFEVTPTQAGSHVVRVVPLTRFGNGNLSILLKDLSTPIIFRLSAGGPTFHMRYDARVPKLGPNAKTPLIERGRVGPVAGDQIITMILENAPPKNARRLKVAGLDARTMAWQLDDKVFVRTPLSLLSPAWNASASSPDGMTVYEIGDAPVLLMSDNGAMVRARLMRDDKQ